MSPKASHLTYHVSPHDFTQVFHSVSVSCFWTCLFKIHVGVICHVQVAETLGTTEVWLRGIAGVWRLEHESFDVLQPTKTTTNKVCV